MPRSTRSIRRRGSTPPTLSEVRRTHPPSASSPATVGREPCSYPADSTSNSNQPHILGLRCGAFSPKLRCQALQAHERTLRWKVNHLEKTAYIVRRISSESAD